MLSHFVETSCSPILKDSSCTTTDATSAQRRKQEDVISSIHTKDVELQQLFRESFLRAGRITHLVQLLGWHKSYLKVNNYIYIGMSVVLLWLI